MKNQKIRSMKVHEQSGYNYKATPTIILKGQWLKEMGFEIGDYISVSCEDGKLIITPDAEKAAMAKAEAEFMEKEMKKLQKRFQTEKKQLHAQFVAERSTEYNGIVSDEDSNKDMIPLLKEHFETVVVPRSGFYNTNRMHNKFCIIDLEYVMHGSYNWTKAANYNGETLVTSVDRELVKKFATEFNETIVENS